MTTACSYLAHGLLVSILVVSISLHLQNNFSVVGDGLLLHVDLLLELLDLLLQMSVLLLLLLQVPFNFSQVVFQVCEVQVLVQRVDFCDVSSSVLLCGVMHHALVG